MEEEQERPKTPQDRILEVVKAAGSLLDLSSGTERRTEVHLSGHTSRSNSTLNLANASLHETPPVAQEVEVESTYVNVIPATSTPKVPERPPAEDRNSPLPSYEEDLDLASNLNETPVRKRTLPSRPMVAPKPSVGSRATSEPPSGLPPHMVLSGGEPLSLPPAGEQSQDSPMPELLSLKDRLKLFEKEIDDQQKLPEPKKDRKFSFLSDDEVLKMKEEEAKRIASMTAMDLEAFDSLTSHLSVEEDTQTLVSHVEELERYDCSEVTLKAAPDEAADGPTTDSPSEGDRKAAWRKARLESLEDDALQAQIVIDKMSELSTEDTVGRGVEGPGRWLTLPETP